MSPPGRRICAETSTHASLPNAGCLIGRRERGWMAGRDVSPTRQSLTWKAIRERLGRGKVRFTNT